MDEIKVGEMFCGVGGFRLGFEWANSEIHRWAFPESSLQPERDSADNEGGARRRYTSPFKTVWSNELDKYACQVYRKQFGEAELVEGDIRDINTASIPEIDLLCAGFPCQTFSIASIKRKGTAESRGALFVQIARVASAKRPKLLLLENVRGLLSSSGGRDFAIILRTLGGLGYILQWQVLNSKFFGVPQNRERVFIVGHLGTKRWKKIFPLSEDAGRSGTPLTAPSGEGQRVRGANLPNLGSLGHQGTGGIFVAPKVANTLSARYAKDGSENLIQLNDDGGSQVNRIYSPDGISPTVPTACGGGHIPKISAYVADGSAVPGPHPFRALRLVRTEEAKKVRSDSMKNGKDYTPFGKGFRTLDECFEQVTGAVTGALNRDTLVGNETNVRRLTPRECERLQGFPEFESLICVKIQDDELCFDLQKSYVNAEIRNPKLQKPVENVERDDKSDNVSYVGKSSSSNSPKTSEPVQKNVLIRSEEGRVRIDYLEKSYSLASFVGSQNSFLQHIGEEGFARMVVGISTIYEKIMLLGREELPQNGQFSIRRENGKLFVRLCGNGMTQLAEDVRRDSTTLKKHLSYITSNPSNIKTVDLNLLTSFFYVMSAIVGCIQSKTELGSSLNLSLLSNYGWTSILSDTQRYKCLGNAVTVPVIEFLALRLWESLQ